MNDIEIEVSQEGPPVTHRSRRGRWSVIHEAILATADNCWLRIGPLSEANAKSLRTSVYNKKIAEKVVIVSDSDVDNGTTFTVWVLGKTKSEAGNELVDATNQTSTTALGEVVESFIAANGDDDVDTDVEGLVVDLSD